MNSFPARFARLIFGLLLYSLGIVMTIRGNIGLTAWDVFHQGITIHTGLSMGLANICVAFALVATAALAGEKIGIGTVFNMILIGVFLDLLLVYEIVPSMGGQISGFALVASGLVVIAFASFFYIGAGFGAGPRDSIMVMIVKRTNIRVGVARGIVEGTVMLIGWLLGGFVGLGTVVAALGISFTVQSVFKLLNFDVKNVRQESISETFAELIGRSKR